MARVPPDFGGFLAGWVPGGERVLVSRYGRGLPVEGMSLTPLNLLQLHKLLGDLIEQGDHEGHLTDEHRRQAGQLPSSHGLDKIIPRSRVDGIAGSD